MKVLVVKLTSMGDVLHVLPALSDLQQAYPDVEIDWVVEENFSEIASWHPSVKQVFPVATRRWRKINADWWQEVSAFYRAIRAQSYDVVIDAQGLMKSALITRLVRGKRVGFCGQSIKESPAAWFYDECFTVNREQHAIARLRQLFAQVFVYPQPIDELNYAIKQRFSERDNSTTPYIVLLHGTTWDTKHLPREYWRELATMATQAGYQVKLTWGNEHEKDRANWVAQGVTQKGAAQNSASISVLPKQSLSQLAEMLALASGVIAVDTGLGHLSAALGCPTVSIYGATDALLTGTVGDKQAHIQTKFLCSPCLQRKCDKVNSNVLKIPCYQSIRPSQIWQTLVSMMFNSRSEVS